MRDRHTKLATAAAIAAVAMGALAAGIATASETITYTYDAKGRLVSVAHSGSVNNNVVSNYAFDHADNRTIQNVTGAP